MKHLINHLCILHRQVFYCQNQLNIRPRHKAESSSAIKLIPFSPCQLRCSDKYNIKLNTSSKSICNDFWENHLTFQISHTPTSHKNLVPESQMYQDLRDKSLFHSQSSLYKKEASCHIHNYGNFLLPKEYQYTKYSNSTFSQHSLQ